MKKKVIVLDASQVSTILKYSGLDGLEVVANRGSKFFYSNDFERFGGP
jgi:hypothetical protein